MNQLVLNQQPQPQLHAVQQVSDLTIQQTTQRLEVTVNELYFGVTETTQSLTITQPTHPQLEVYVNQSALELFPEAIIYQNFGAGVADQDTILGTGNHHDPYRAPDMLRVSRRLSEFDTQTARHEARDNLGLNIIDGGTFQ